MKNVNYGMKVELGPSGQTMYSVQKNGYPLSIYVTDVKTASAVVELLCQEYNAGFCDGNEDTLGSMTMREPTEAEVDTFLNMRGLTKVTIANASMPIWALDMAEFLGDDPVVNEKNRRNEQVDKNRSRNIQPDDLKRDKISFGLMERARVYLDVIESMSENDIETRLGVMVTDCGMAINIREEMADGMNQYERVLDDANAGFEDQNDMKVADAEAMEDPESAKFLIGNITGELMHAAQSFYKDQCGLEGEDLDKAMNTALYNVYDGEILRVRLAQEILGYKGFGTRIPQPDDGQDEFGVIDEEMPPSLGDIIRQHMKDTGVNVGDFLEETVDNVSRMYAQNYEDGGVHRFDHVPCCGIPTIDMMREIKGINPPMTNNHCGGKPVCNDSGYNGEIEADPTSRDDDGITKPCEEYYTTDDSFMKDVVPPQTIGDIDKRQAALRDPKVTHAVKIDNNELINYLSHDWEFYDKVDQFSVIVVLYESTRG